MTMMISSQLNYKAYAYTYTSYSSYYCSTINPKLINVSLKSSIINIRVISSFPPPPPRSSSSSCPRCQQQMQTPIQLQTEEEQDKEKEEALHYPSTTTTTTHGREKEKEKEEGISGIQVPRQKYISVSKSDLLAAILSSMFQIDADDFTRFSSCLDSIIHAEHKRILEDMRTHYHFPSSSSGSQTNNTKQHLEAEPNFSLLDNLRTFLFGAISISISSPLLKPKPKPKPTTTTTTTSTKTNSTVASADSSIAVASHFQRAFLKLLQDAQFEELSVRDLLLTSSLNTDYLLTLPIYVDWKRASDSNTIVFRRGYATERQKGFLIVDKLDYLQSKLLQGIFFSLSKPLGEVGMLIKEAFESASPRQELQIWIERVKVWLKESFSQQTYSDNDKTFDNQLASNQLFVSDLPIWLAAQRAVPRYEGLLQSVGPRGRLLRKLLAWIGLIPSAPKTSPDLNSDNTTSEPYLRPSFLSRITLGDIWRPATKEYCGNDSLKMLKTAISILFSQSTLQEPAFQELILLYNEGQGQRENEYKAEMSTLKLKIYERIPIPDLPVVFPDKKLSFRILDTLRLDVASILGLLAFLVNYKFEDILSSPSAVLLDVIAVSAFVIYLSRLALGYKQTWDRYQLLVNRTLYEKTLASGFGSVHFLLDASEQQQYKEALLAYAVLLQAKEGQVTCRKFVGDTCEKFIYNSFNEKVEMPVDKAINTLLRLGVVTEISTDLNIRLQALPCSEGYEALKRHWDLLLG